MALIGFSQLQSMRQEMRMTPQMIQLQELLQLPLQHLEQRINQELMENPALEMVEMEPGEVEAKDLAETEYGDDVENALLERQAEESFASADQLDYEWSDDFDEPAPRMRASGDGGEDEKYDALYNAPDRPLSLQQALEDQLPDLALSDRERSLAQRVIFALDDMGYLQGSLVNVFAETRGGRPPSEDGALRNRIIRSAVDYLSQGAIDYSLEVGILKRFMPDLVRGRADAVVRVLSREHRGTIEEEADEANGGGENDEKVESAAKIRDRFAQVVKDLSALMWRGVEEEIRALFRALHQHRELITDSSFSELLLRIQEEASADTPLAIKLLTSHCESVAQLPLEEVGRELQCPLERLRAVAGRLAFHMEEEIQACCLAVAYCEESPAFPADLQEVLIERVQESSFPDERALFLLQEGYAHLADGDLDALEVGLGLGTYGATSSLMTLWNLMEDQMLEPAGVGCRSLQECLLLQVQRLPGRYDFESTVIRNHIDDLAANRLPVVAKALDCSIEEVKAVAEFLKTLTPHPGLGYGDTVGNQITPDLEVRVEDGEFIIKLYRGGLPELRINPLCKEALKDGEAEAEAKKYLREKIANAEWMIRSIEQRNRTLQSVAREIVIHQKDYLLGREVMPGPLEMQGVADRVGVDISTVSRAVREKYAVTPRGIVCLRDLFTRKV
ncbi:MAG: RNA polymerase factor sigma-54, partial [Planctomycetota bacterium]